MGKGVDNNKMGKFKEHLATVVNPTWNFSGRLVTQQDHEQNALVGLASEAGEALDIGKKNWFHSRKENGHRRQELVSELGDVIYYWLKALDVHGITMKEVLEYNKKKLESRHPELGQVQVRYDKDHIRG